MVRLKEPILVPIGKLTSNPKNPKKPMSKASRAALRLSLERFGMSAALNVAPEPDGLYLILDGDTRVEDLRAASVPSVWCIVHEDMAHDAGPEAASLREEFVLAYDRTRKKFDEDEVRARLGSLVEAGRDAGHLSSLLARRERKARAPAEVVPADEGRAARVKSAIDAATARASASDSLVIHGPKDEIDEIRSLLAETRATATSSATLSRLLREAKTRIASDDETFLTALALAFARLIE